MSQQYQLTGQLHELASAKQGEILFFRTPELPSGLYTVESAVFDAIGAAIQHPGRHARSAAVRAAGSR